MLALAFAAIAGTTARTLACMSIRMFQTNSVYGVA